MSKYFLRAIAVSTALIASPVYSQNMLVNPGFEDAQGVHGPNHANHATNPEVSILPWVISGGTDALYNIYKVTGAPNNLPGSPNDDADADSVGGQFLQTGLGSSVVIGSASKFTRQEFEVLCDGTYNFGAAFNHRNGAAVQGKVVIRESGNPNTIAQASASVAGSPSPEITPWAVASSSVTLSAAQSYMFEIWNAKYAVADDAFVIPQQPCSIFDQTSLPSVAPYIAFGERSFAHGSSTTSGGDDYTYASFALNDPLIANGASSRRSKPLHKFNRDFVGRELLVASAMDGTISENYDIYLSDEYGNPLANGYCVAIDVTWYKTPSKGGQIFDVHLRDSPVSPANFGDATVGRTAAGGGNYFDYVNVTVPGQINHVPAWDSKALSGAWMGNAGTGHSWGDHTVLGNMDLNTNPRDSTQNPMQIVLCRYAQ